MALEIFDGRPGDGKSYNAMALKILPHLARGGFVATNIEVKPEGIAKWIKARTGKIFRPDRLRFLEDHEVPAFHKHIPQGTEKTQVLVVIDEAHLWFNSRDWQKNDSEHRQTFVLATQHRKYFLDIILISQHFGNIDAQFLRLIEKLWRFRDYSKWHVPFFPFLKMPFFRFLAACYDRSGKTVLDRYWQPFSKLVGDTYNTRAVSRGSQMSGTVDDVQLEADPEATKKVRKINAVINWVLILLLLAAVAGGSYWYGKRQNPPAEPTRKAGTAMVATPAPARSDPPAVLDRPAITAVKPKPERWLDTPPPVELVDLQWYAGNASHPLLCVEMDGYRQVLEMGGMTSRGRVMRLTRHNAKTWDLEFSPEMGQRRVLRAIVKPYNGPIGAQVPQMPGGGQNAPDPNNLGVSAAPTTYTLPPPP